MDMERLQEKEYMKIFVVRGKAKRSFIGTNNSIRMRNKIISSVEIMGSGVKY